MTQRNTYGIDLDAAIKSIKQINSSMTMLASDGLMSKNFDRVEASLEADTMAERVVLLDGLWGTRLFMEAGASDRIVSNLMANSDFMLDELGQLEDDTLEYCPEKVISVARKVLPIILNHSQDGKKHRQNYSFATKFFHWTTRNHFPIVDSRARKRINDVQTSHGVKSRVRRSTAAMNGLTYIKEYERWIYFYSDLLGSLGDKNKEVLKQADLDSQPHGYRRGNSLLRILDKVFYGQGGGSGQGRVSD